MLSLEKSSPRISAPKDQPPDWIQALSQGLSFTDQRVRQGLRATVSSKIIDDKVHLFIPPELAQLQPDVLRYLHALGAAHNFTLVEDRRSVDIEPIAERRSARPNDLALGVSLLLKQTGLPGPAHSLSEPHILRPDNPRITLPRLIRMAAQVQADSKKVIFVPNRFLTGDFGQQAEPMMGYACRVITHDEQLVLSYFDAAEFHALGYISNDQFVIHVFLAGGPITAPRIWSPLGIITDAAFRCQIFTSNSPAHHVGLLYNTFYIDMETSMEDESWWAGIEPDEPLADGRAN